MLSKDQDKIKAFSYILGWTLKDAPEICVDDNPVARSILSKAFREFADMIDTQKFNPDITSMMSAYCFTQAKLALQGDLD